MTTLFVKYTFNGAAAYAFYDGMTEETVSGLIAQMGGTEIEFISQPDWAAAVAAVAG